jgi:hypothetical protein
MAFSLYDLSVSRPIYMLETTLAFLEKAQQHAQQLKVDFSVYLQARLAPDMFTLAKQIEVLTFLAHSGPARLMGQNPERLTEKEVSLEDLKKRIQDTIYFLATIKPDDVNSKEDTVVELQGPSGSRRFKGNDYVFYFLIPNLHFHMTVIYAILRHNGAPLGKADFLGKLPLL